LYVVKRIMGVPGDRIHLRNGVVYRNGEELNEPYVITRRTRRSIRIRIATIFRRCRRQRITNVYPNWEPELPMHIQGDDLVVPPGRYFAMGDQPRREPGQPVLGIYSAGKYHWAADVHLLVV
jgi:signal peptidase I